MVDQEVRSEQRTRMGTGAGFIAALDQSGGSTPKALGLYGIPDGSWSNEDEMFDLVHQMRTRIVTSPEFTKEHILAAILFEQTMNREIEGVPTAQYLWENKGIIPILKVDKGLAAAESGVQLMKPIPGLDALLAHAQDKGIFGTKMRSVVKEANEAGIAAIIAQQFDLGAQIAATGLVPILEPEVDIHCPDKESAEQLLLADILKHLETWPGERPIMFKLTIPSEPDLYAQLMRRDEVLRVVALSGGYTRHEACELLKLNHGLIASFSRALSQGLRVDQTDAEFNATLAASIKEIAEASAT